MSFSTYSDLQNSILQWLGRPNDPLIPTADLIALFEADASRQLRTHYQETSTTINTIPGIATYSLPANFLAPREAKLTNITPTLVLDYLTPTQLDDTYQQNERSRPIHYTLEGSNIRFGPIPSALYSIRLEYWGAVPALSDNSFAASTTPSDLDIVAPGAGYAVGDVLIVSDGDVSKQATLIGVDSVSADDSYAATSFVIGASGSAYTAGDIIVVAGGTVGSQAAEITVDTVALDNGYHVTGRTIDSGGSGYGVGNVLTIVGGIFVTPAQLTVSSVSGGGSITGVTISQAGAYTTQPANPVSVTGGAGTGATFDLTFSLLYAIGAVITAHISDGGDYSATPANNAATTGGSGIGATLNVTWTFEAAAGEITAAHIIEAGDYVTGPSNPVATTGGSGDEAATFNLSYVHTGGNSNWLLANFPDAYLWGSLAEAELFLGADNSTPRFQLFLQRRETAYAAIRIQDQRFRLGGAPLVMKTDVRNP